MPRDKRLFMTFPNDFWQHPKIAPLSDAAFRTFVELNGYSRMQDLDGSIPVAFARRQWKPRALGELLANHPDRPSLSVVEDCYVIWNYDEHQETKATIAARVAKNTVNGAKGGRPPKQNPNETQSVTERNPMETHSKPESESESESESDIELDVTYVPQSGQEGDAPIRGLDGGNPVISARAKSAGIHDLAAVRTLLEATSGHPVSPLGAVLLTEAITSKAKLLVKDVDAYVATVCRRTAGEVRDAYFDLDIEAVAS
jgi:hypothetical protein